MNQFYVLYEGEAGSAFGNRRVLGNSDLVGELRGIMLFLKHNPQVHDMSWSCDDGRTFVVKRVIEATEEQP